MPRIHSKTLYSPMVRENFYGESKKLWESAIDWLFWIYLRDFRETIKPFSCVFGLRTWKHENNFVRSLVLVRCSSNGFARWWNGCSHFIFLWQFILLADSETKRWKFIIASLDVTLCTASSLQVSVVWRMFLIRGYYIATTVLVFLKTPLFEMAFWFSFFNLEQQEMCVCVCRTFVSKYSLS